MSTFEAFKKAIDSHVADVIAKKDSTENEDNVRRILIMPLFRCLGYDIDSPLEFMFAYPVPIGKRTGSGRSDEADVVFYRNEKPYIRVTPGTPDDYPYIVVECKEGEFGDSSHKKYKECEDQLRRYFHLIPSSKFGILTNGIQYQFFGEKEEGQNVMEEHPFLTFDITKLKTPDYEALYHFRKAVEPEDTLTAVVELRYKAAIRRNIHRLMQEPSKEFADVLTDGVPLPLSSKRKKAVKEHLRKWTGEVFMRVIGERAAEEFQSTQSKSASTAQEEVVSTAFLTTIRGMCLDLCKSERLILQEVTGGYAVSYETFNKPVAYLIKRGDTFRFSSALRQVLIKKYSTYENADSLKAHYETIRAAVRYRMDSKNNPMPAAWDTPSKETNKDESAT